MSGIEEILGEIKKIKQVLYIIGSEKITEELLKVATTPERKKIWVLIDGKNDVDNIAKKVGISPRGVRYTLALFEGSKYIIYQYGKPPIRVIDYVPPEWVKLIIEEYKETEVKEAKNDEQKAE